MSVLLVESPQIQTPVAFWSSAAADRLSQLGDPPQYTANATPSTLALLAAEENALRRAQQALTSARYDEERAMQHAMRTLRDRFKDQDRALAHAIRTLRSHHNALAPVSRLPPELLALVFTRLADGDRPVQPLTLQVLKPARLGWIVVTQVCGRWRHVALEHPALWAQILLPMGKEWVTAMFARSKGAPLFIHGWSPGQHVRNLSLRERDLMVANLPRTKLVRLVISGKANSNLLDAFTAPAPALETLDLMVKRSPAEAEPIFPPGFFGDRAPSLRHVRLHTTARFPWTSPLLQNIVSLEMLLLPMDRLNHMNRAPLSDIVGAMQNLHTLESLTLDLVLPDSESDPVSPSSDTLPTADLPNLAYLYLVATARDAGPFLAHLSIPADTIAHLKIEHPPSALSNTHVSMFLLALLSSLRLPSGRPAPPFAKVSLTSTGDYQESSSYTTDMVTVQAWRDTGASEQIPTLFLKFMSSDLAWSERSSALAAVRVLAGAGLRELVVTLKMDQWTREMWRSALEGATALRVLEAWGPPAVSLCCVLHDPSPLSSAVEFLPVLERLTLCYVHFDTAEVVARGVHAESDVLALGEVLAAWLAARALAGHRLHELDVETCYVSPECVDALRGAVPGMAVKWTDRSDRS